MNEEIEMNQAEKDIGGHGAEYKLWRIPLLRSSGYLCQVRLVTGCPMRYFQLGLARSERLRLSRGGPESSLLSAQSLVVPWSSL